MAQARRPALRCLAALCLALLAPALVLAQTTSGTTPPAKKSRARKSASGVQVGDATVVTSATGDSGPVRLSTTGGAGGNDNKWPNFAALQKAADEQNPDALYELGISYLQGTPDTPKNITRALLNLGEAARLGHTAANFRLGKLHADGDETPRDQRKALAYYTAAARAGDPIAQHNVGAMISSGRGVEKRDYAEGLAWLILAARKNPDAAESEKKLRDFLAKSPQTIAAAEARAGELARELAAAKSAPKPADPAKPKIETPKMDIAPMPVPAPTMTIPPPSLTPGGAGD